MPHSNLKRRYSGYKKGKLRGHSDYYWNKPVNEWAWTFTEDFDIMCEAGSTGFTIHKNLFYKPLINKTFEHVISIDYV